MPTHDPKKALSADEARYRAGQKAFAKRSGAPLHDGIGLEPEYFPVVVDAEGQPTGRVALEGPGGVVETIDGVASREPWVGVRQGPARGPWEYQLGNGGRLTFEPGAQIEHSSAVFSSAAEALADVQTVLDRLRGAFAPRGATLAATGLDPWNDLETVPQQLRADRYTAMATYYDRIGPWGAVMMRHTASLQVNLDLGADGVWQERWLAANLISPLITASFACSPSATAVCQRARAWQQLDPSRTGYPTLLVGGDGTDPAGEWAQAALAANVMLVRRPDGRSEPCEPGWSFSHWIESGHPDHGWPTAEDLDYHLTTLFFEVRPRGFFELRAGEALSDRWRAAIVVLVSAALYDDRARAKTLAALGDSRGRLPDLWLRAATQGVRDPEIGELADQVWRAALDGARRMPLGFFDDTSLNTTQAFLERFTFERRMPADDLLELQRTDPARALEWATTGGACSAPAHACL